MFISTSLWNSFGIGKESQDVLLAVQPLGCSLTQEAPGVENEISALHVQRVVHSIHGCRSVRVADVMVSSVLLCVELCAFSSVKEVKPLGL